MLAIMDLEFTFLWDPGEESGRFAVLWGLYLEGRAPK